MTSICAVTCVKLDDDQRIGYPAKNFGMHFPFRVEPLIYAFASKLSCDYRGGHWEMYALCNGGFYMAPDDDRDFNVRCENGYEGTMSADAFGITCCLYAFSHLSFTANGEIAKVFASSYHVLREFAMNHAEVAAIVAATD